MSILASDGGEVQKYRQRKYRLQENRQLDISVQRYWFPNDSVQKYSCKNKSKYRQYKLRWRNRVYRQYWEDSKLQTKLLV